MKYLIVVDMQVDFITGSLGSELATAIVPNIVEKVKSFDGKVIFTRDTHFEDYMNTQEGRNLPVPHCIKDSDGWQICDELKPYAETVVDKLTFGSIELLTRLPMAIEAGLTGDIINFVITTIAFLVIGYFVSYFMIGKFKFATPGRLGNYTTDGGDDEAHQSPPCQRQMDVEYLLGKAHHLFFRRIDEDQPLAEGQSQTAQNGDKGNAGTSHQSSPL
mgnify:CR=1 FL=1